MLVPPPAVEVRLPVLVVAVVRRSVDVLVFGHPSIMPGRWFFETPFMPGPSVVE
jgi:hypothetical protein